jgi:hypothetical protein
MIAIAFVSFAALALLIFYLFCAIGHHPNEKEIRSGILEKIPLDIFTAIYLIAVLLFVIIVLLIIGYGSFNILTVSVLMFLGIVAYLITLMYTLSFALRIKCGGILKNLLLYRICRWIVRKTAAMIGCIPLIWKTLIGIFLYVLSDWIVLILFDGGWDHFLIFYVLKNLIVAILLISFVIALKKLQKGGEKIARKARKDARKKGDEKGHRGQTQREVFEENPIPRRQLFRVLRNLFIAALRTGKRTQIRGLARVRRQSGRRD